MNNFIKSKISVFNIIGILLIIISIILFFSSVNRLDYHGYARGFAYLFFLFSLLLLFLDFIFRKFIYDRMNLNILEAGLFIFSLTIFLNLIS
tara:strand:- start:8554 stop:8829 length:276 start_codon:yes stop_codon:yes gene_type:complete